MIFKGSRVRELNHCQFLPREVIKSRTRLEINKMLLKNFAMWSFEDGSIKRLKEALSEGVAICYKTEVGTGTCAAFELTFEEKRQAHNEFLGFEIYDLLSMES